MCEIKTVLVSICLILLVTASLCIYRAYPERKVGDNRKIEGQGPCENEYKQFCLNEGECYYLIDEDIVVCNSTWLYGGKRCEK